MSNDCSIKVHGDELSKFKFETEDLGHGNYQVIISYRRNHLSELVGLTTNFPSKEIVKDWINGTLMLIGGASNDAVSASIDAVIVFNGRLRHIDKTWIHDETWVQMDNFVIGFSAASRRGS
jgi:hypothetical protein